MKEFQDICDEDEELRRKMEKPELFGKETGQDVAAIMSGLLAGIVILTFAFMHFSKIVVFE
jgi:type IV secretory pathway TrbD component